MNKMEYVTKCNLLSNEIQTYISIMAYNGMLNDTQTKEINERLQEIKGYLSQ